MTFPIYGKSKKIMFQTTNQIIIIPCYSYDILIFPVDVRNHQPDIFPLVMTNIAMEAMARRNR